MKVWNIDGAVSTVGVVVIEWIKQCFNLKISAVCMLLNTEVLVLLDYWNTEDYLYFKCMF